MLSWGTMLLWIKPEAPTRPTVPSPSEHTGHRSLEQDRQVVQVLPNWGWVLVLNKKNVTDLLYELLTQSTSFTPSAGMLSHQLKQHLIDGEKTIIQNPTDQQRWASSANRCPLSCLHRRRMTTVCAFFFQKGPWEGWVRSAWGLCSGCADQHRGGKGMVYSGVITFFLS